MTHDRADPLLTEIRLALSAAEPLVALEELAKAEAASGTKQETLYAAFERALACAAVEPSDKSYDSLVEAMDLIVGWCAPGSAIYPPPPSEV